MPISRKRLAEVVRAADIAIGCCDSLAATVLALEDGKYDLPTVLGVLKRELTALGLPPHCLNEARGIVEGEKTRALIGKKAADRQQRYRMRKVCNENARDEMAMVGEDYDPGQRYTRDTIGEWFAEQERVKAMAEQVKAPSEDGLSQPPALSPDDTFLAQLAAITPQPLPGRSENIFKMKDERDGE